MGMVTVKCPSCGADIQLDDSREFGFCNYCGTKVVQDKVIVEHTGSVSIDNSEVIKNALEIARRSKDNCDWEETEKQYKIVEQYEPKNIEAVFYISYSKTMPTLAQTDMIKRQNAFTVLKKCILSLDDYFDIEREEEQKSLIKNISTDILALSGSQYLYKAGALSFDNVQTKEMINNTNRSFCLFLEKIILKYPTKDDRVIDYYKLAILHRKVEYIIFTGTATFTSDIPNVAKEISLYHQKWHEIDPTHQVLTPEEVNNSQKADKSKSSGGCYVATAVYGSYDCPQVWTLRRYRDNQLAKTKYGRAFIRTYYAISPTLVKWFGHTDWFKKMWRGKLDRMVQELNSNGVENTPYNDIEW